MSPRRAAANAAMAIAILAAAKPRCPVREIALARQIDQNKYTTATERLGRQI